MIRDNDFRANWQWQEHLIHQVPGLPWLHISVCCNSVWLCLHKGVHLLPFFMKSRTATGRPVDPHATRLQIVAVVSTDAPEVRGSSSRRLVVAICAAWVAMAAPTAGFAGDKTAPDIDAPTQLRVWTGPEKPSLALEDMDGRRVRLEPADGTVSVVHFFATWCEPCRAELPALDRLIARSDPSKLRVLVISVAEVEGRIRSFVERNPVKLQILLDRDRSVARSWQVHSLPTTFILDRDFRPRLFVEREYDWDNFDVTSFTKAMTIQKRANAPANATPISAATDLKGE